MTDTAALRGAVDYAAQPKQLLIGGKWTDARGQETTGTENPVTGGQLAALAEAQPEDVDAAVAAARAALEDPGLVRAAPRASEPSCCSSSRTRSRPGWMSSPPWRRSTPASRCATPPASTSRRPSTTCGTSPAG